MPSFTAKVDMVEPPVATTCVNTMEMNTDGENHIEGFIPQRKSETWAGRHKGYVISS